MYLMKDAPRKTYARDQATTDLVAEIIRNVQTNGDRELLALTEKFDHVTMDTVRVSASADHRDASSGRNPRTSTDSDRDRRRLCSGGTLSASQLRPHAGNSGKGRRRQDRCGVQPSLQGL